MATTTQNLGLIKPAGTDKIRIAQINSNMDTLDAKIGPVGSTPLQTQVQNLQDGLAILANGNVHAAITSGQYVYVRNHGSLAEGLYKATAAIAANGTLSSSNLTADAAGGLNALKSSVDELNTNLAKRIPTSTSSSAEIIQSGENLNDYKTGGIYIVATDSIAAAISNMPRAASGRLIVVPVFSDDADYVQQYYIPSTAVNVVYCRKFYASSASVPWSPWSKMANYIVDSGTVTTSSNGTASFANTYNTNEYACLSVFTTSAVSGYILIPYKYGDAANGRWGFKACKSSDMSGFANESITYVAILMPYIAT